MTRSRNRKYKKLKSQLFYTNQKFEGYPHRNHRTRREPRKLEGTKKKILEKIKEQEYKTQLYEIKRKRYNK